MLGAMAPSLVYGFADCMDHGAYPLVNFDAETYKGRNPAERSFSLFKQWRCIATRYDKLALTYRAGVVLYGVVIWLGQ